MYCVLLPTCLKLNNGCTPDSISTSGSGSVSGSGSGTGSGSGSVSGSGSGSGSFESVKVSGNSVIEP